MKTLSSQVVYQNRWMRVREDKVELADGSSGLYGVVEKVDFALIIPFDGTNVFLVEQFRYPINERHHEFPQGMLDPRDTDCMQAARRELLEETGIQAASMTKLGHLNLAAGYSTQGFDVFLATELTHGKQQLEPEEHGLVVIGYTIAEIEAMICSGKLKDNASIAALCLWRLKDRAGQAD